MIPVALGPEGTESWLAAAVVAGNGEVSEPAKAEVLVWTKPDRADLLGSLLAEHPGIRWVQFPFAGIELQVDVVRAHPERIWTCAKGAYAEPVAELALALLLAGLRDLGTYLRATTWLQP